MTEWGFWLLSNVSNERLEEQLRGLLSSAGTAEARIVAHLAELDARQLPLLRGQSLWDYCLTTLGLSESEAFYRIGAARLGRRFPLVFQLLERREIHLTALVLLNKYLTDENHAELLAEASGKSKRALLELLVSRFPKADIASGLRKLPVPREAISAGPTGSLEPRSPDRYCLRLELTAAQTAKLERARDLLSHSNPMGDLAVVVERALDLLVDQFERRRFAKRTGDLSLALQPESNPSLASQPGNLAAQPGSDLGIPLRTDGDASLKPSQPHFGQPKHHPSEHQRPEHQQPAEQLRPVPHRPHISHETRRQVLARDGAQCAYVGENGRRCHERAFLQFHHIVPFARGGDDTAKNLQLVCARHNRLLAQREGLASTAA